MTAALPGFPPYTSASADAAASAPSPMGVEADTMIIRLRPARDRGTTLLVAATALAMSVAAVAYFLHQHSILGIRDSYSHLEISRRVVVGRSVGIAQLGGIWLPVPHVLQALFAWNWTLYRTGLAGSAVSAGAYIACAVLVYKIVRVLTDYRRWPAVVGALVFITNANVLYQQSTSMDELPSYAFTLAAIYGLVQWAATKRAGYVLSASLASMLAMLCRYEEWYLGLLYVACVVLMARRLGHSWRDTRGLGLVMALFGVAVPAGGWLLYNWLIFGSPVNFLTGPNSSSDQMATQQNEPEIHNWALTLHAYGVAIASDLGLAVAATAAAAFVVFVVRERLSARALPILVLTAVLPFFVYSLESGQEPIGIPSVNGGLTNLRFGLIALLPAAILIGYLVGLLPTRRPKLTFAPVVALAVAALFALNATTFATHGVVLQHEAAENAAGQITPTEAGDYLTKHTKGPILIDVVRNERVAFLSLDRTVYSGTRDAEGNEWTRALADPRSLGIDVVVMRTTPTDRDKVYQALYGTPMLKAYKLAYQNTDYQVYVLSDTQ
jgi:hypothetical protein